MTYQAFMRQAGEAHAQREERYKAKLSEVRCEPRPSCRTHQLTAGRASAFPAGA